MVNRVFYKTYQGGHYGKRKKTQYGRGQRKKATP